MRASTLIALLFCLGSCTAPAGEDLASLSAADTVVTGSTDPIDHLKVIASSEMDGRNTPSAGLDKATDYVVGECVRAGLKVFKQPFTFSGQTVNNVVAFLPGSGEHKDEIVLFSAHLDHLGHGYPGADDNGSGSAALVAIAHRLVAERKQHPIDRTVGFLWTVGEEKGLLGSKHFTAHPPPEAPLDRIAQVINLDAIGALETTRFSILPDAAPHTLATAATMEDVAAEMDPPFTRINRDLQAYTQRTDAASFVRKGVPAMWVSEGLTHPEGGGPLMARYHRPTDTVENMIAENGGDKLRRMTTMLVLTAQRLTFAP